MQRPVLWTTNQSPLCVDLESDLAGLPVKTFQTGTLCTAADTSLTYVWIQSSPAASVPGVSVSVPGVGAWLAFEIGALGAGDVNTVVGAAGTQSLQRIVPTSPVTVNVKGYSIPGDGGGGAFYWDSTSAATDDGGTIIRPVGLLVGAWIRVYSGAINVRWFGATGNGVTDDVTAINAAKAVAVAKNLALYAPAGVYAHSTTLTFSTDGFTLYGDGCGGGTSGAAIDIPITQFKYTGAGNGVFLDGGALVTQGAFGMYVHDIYFSGNAGATILLRCRAVHHSTLSNLRFSTCTTAAIKWEFGVTNVLNNIRASVIENTFAAQYGIWLTERGAAPGESFTASNINVPIIEGASVAGIFHEAGNNVVITAGTCEAGGKGLLLAATTQTDTIISLDNEGNTDRDYDIGGFGHTFISCLGSSTNGAAITYTADAGTDTLTKVNHGLANGTPLVLTNSGGTFPAGLVGVTTYFVINTAADTFQLATKVGGAAINFTTNGTGTNKYATAKAGIILNADAGSGYGCTIVNGQFRNILLADGTPAAQLNNLYAVQFIDSYTDLGSSTQSIGVWRSSTGPIANKLSSGTAATGGMTVDTLTATTQVNTNAINSPAGDLLTYVNGSLATELFAGGLALYKNGLVFGSATTPLFGQNPAAAGNGGNFEALAQAAATGSNGHGGDFLIQGGAKDGSGLQGGAKLQIGQGASTLLHCAETISGNNATCLNGAITATNLPVNTGSGIIVILNATTAPTANPAAGTMILYVDPADGILKTRGSAGTVTPLANP